jgi:hypothetical protein
LNLFQYENSGHLNGHVLNFTLAQTSYKRFNLNLSGWWVVFKSDAPSQIAPPQSSYSNRGESSRPDWKSSGGSLDGTLHLPYKLTFHRNFQHAKAVPTPSRPARMRMGMALSMIVLHTLPQRGRGFIARHLDCSRRTR